MSRIVPGTLGPWFSNSSFLILIELKGNKRWNLFKSKNHVQSLRVNGLSILDCSDFQKFSFEKKFMRESDVAKEAHNLLQSDFIFVVAIMVRSTLITTKQ